MNIRRIVVKCAVVCVGVLALDVLPSSRALAGAENHQSNAAGLIMPCVKRPRVSRTSRLLKRKGTR